LTLLNFLSGAVAFGFVIAGLFFLSFWRRTRDALFMAFAFAFALLGIGQSVSTLADLADDNRSAVYLFRLAAFLVIIFAILRKNRALR